MSDIVFACLRCHGKSGPIARSPFQTVGASPYPWQEETITYQYPKNGMTVTLRVPFCSPFCHQAWQTDPTVREGVLRHLSGLQVLP